MSENKEVGYAELLASYIENSGLSIGEIARRMDEEKGVKADRSYISMLKNGKTKNPASEEINRAIAEVTGGDPDKLILAGYIEKAPQEVKDYIKNYADHIDSYTRMVSVFMAESEIDSDEWKDEVDKIHATLSKIPIEHRFDFVINHYNRVAISDNNFLQSFGEASGIPQERINQTIESIKEKPLNRIAVLDLENDSTDYDWIATSKIRFGEYMYVIANDESMSGAGINKGSKVLCKQMESPFSEPEVFQDGKIYFVDYKEDLMFRRVFKRDNHPYLLQAENPKFPPIFIDEKEAEGDDFKILALVESVEFNPNKN